MKHPAFYLCTIVPALYGQLHSTKLFHRGAAGIEGIQVKSLPLSAKHTADDTLFYRNRLTLDLSRPDTAELSKLTEWVLFSGALMVAAPVS